MAASNLEAARKRRRQKDLLETKHKIPGTPDFVKMSNVEFVLYMRKCGMDDAEIMETIEVKTKADQETLIKAVGQAEKKQKAAMVKSIYDSAMSGDAQMMKMIATMQLGWSEGDNTDGSDVIPLNIHLHPTKVTKKGKNGNGARSPSNGSSK